MRVICSICKEVLKIKKGEGDSHTICPRCMPAYLREQGFSTEEIKEFEEKYKV